MSDERTPLPGFPGLPRDPEDDDPAPEPPTEDPDSGDPAAGGPDSGSEEPAETAPGSEPEPEPDGAAGDAAEVDDAEVDDADDASDAEPEPQPRGSDRGTVKWYSLAKGYGFLLDEAGGPDIFVHHSALKEAGESEPLIEGERVEFQLEDTPRGRRARHVRRIQ